MKHFLPLLLMCLLASPLWADQIAGNDYHVITPSQVGPATLGQNVRLNQVSYYSGQVTDFDGETCECYIDYSPILPAVLCWSYDVYGYVNARQSGSPFSQGVTEYFVQVTGIGKNCNYNDTANIKRFEYLYKLDEGYLGEYFDLTGHFVESITAVYQNSIYLYVRDIAGEYGLVYGQVNGRFINGDIIQDAKAKPLRYGNTYMIHPEVPSSFVRAKHSIPVEPDLTTISNATRMKDHHYVTFEAVNIVNENASNYNIKDDSGNMLKVINRFNIEMNPVPECPVWPSQFSNEVTIADLNFLIDIILSRNTNSWDGTYDIEGFLSKSNNQLALIPIRVKCHGDPVNYACCDLNGDDEVNISDVSTLIDIILRNN